MSQRSQLHACDLDWVRHVNARWLVGESLRRDAVDYLGHLEASDPDRLGETCRQVHRLFDRRRPGEDPKPWFYAGLFSLATPAEARRFLRGHDFTIACIPGLARAGLGTLRSEDLRPDSADKLRRIRAILTELEQSPPPGAR